MDNVTNMRHYEIVFLVHPDRSDQVPSMIERYTTLVKKHAGVIHRLEDWGRRQLTYSIKKVRKAHYVLMNIECGLVTLNELKDNFYYNDAVLRELIIKVERAITEPSPVLKEKIGREENSSQTGSGQHHSNFSSKREGHHTTRPAQEKTDSMGSSAIEDVPAKETIIVDEQAK